MNMSATVLTTGDYRRYWLINPNTPSWGSTAPRYQDWVSPFRRPAVSRLTDWVCNSMIFRLWSGGRQWGTCDHYNLLGTRSLWWRNKFLPCQPWISSQFSLVTAASIVSSSPSINWFEISEEIEEEIPRCLQGGWTDIFKLEHLVVWYLKFILFGETELLSFYDDSKGIEFRVNLVPPSGLFQIQDLRQYKAVTSAILSPD